MSHVDVIIVGAGVAGLSAAGELGRAGRTVLVLEASNRIGGRVFTTHTEEGPIELGAEFVHGKPPALSQLIEKNGFKLEELDGHALRSQNGKLTRGGDFFPKVLRVLDTLRTEGADRSFIEALQAQDHLDEETRQPALEYVAGFHAADPAKISEHALAKSTRSGEREGSDHAFRILEGYQTVVDALRSQLASSTRIELNAQVTEIDWKRGSVHVRTKSGESVTGEAVIVTVPLPIWDQLRIDPDLPQKRAALKKLAMGPVLRVSLRFDAPWWHNIQDGKAKNLSFVFSQHPDFPTWWRGTSAQPNTLTAWSAALRATRLSSLTDEEIIARAVSAAAEAFGVPNAELQARLVHGWTHNWQRDPFFLGAYSYVLAGGEAAPRELAAPVEGTIFVGGEATDFVGDNGTVHAAMSSGIRAVWEYLDSRRR